MFHLWFHPSNFFTKTDDQFLVLEEILRHAQRLRDSGALEVLTFADIRRRLLEERPGPAHLTPSAPRGRSKGEGYEPRGHGALAE